MWLGKILGALFGYLLTGGHWLGVLVGVLIGHWFDRGRARVRLMAGRYRQVHETFFRASFRVMGYVSKADGQVSQAEIRAAEAVMDRMQLGEGQRERAINAFREGKAADFDLDSEIDEFLRVCRRQGQLVRLFLEIQLQAALADGRIDDSEREVLLGIARRLGISDADYQRLESLLTGGYRRAHARETQADELQEAYRELGVDPNADDSEIKRAYRRLMSEHHPDKLMSRGMPEEMINVAKERTQAIQSAYETIKRARGLR
jgi:DnaJ like chaperone protein